MRLPGYLEVHAGVYMRCTNLARGSCYNFAPKSFSASVVWDRHYSRMFSYYAQLTWVPERKAVDGDPEAADWTVSVGPSLLLLLGPKKAPLFPHALRVRVGYRLDWRNWRIRFDRSGWEIQLSAAQ